MNITVYCASAEKIQSAYFEAATELGKCIGQQSWTLVYGGTDCGLMKCCADAVLANGGSTLGIIPECIYQRGVQAKTSSKLMITPDMKERKELMRVHGDAFVALPGGWGTLEEITEVVTLKQLGVHNKPIVFINIDGYYDLFFSFINDSKANGFIGDSYDKLYHITSSIQEALEYIHHYQEEDIKNKY